MKCFIINDVDASTLFASKIVVNMFVKLLITVNRKNETRSYIHLVQFDLPVPAIRTHR